MGNKNDARKRRKSGQMKFETRSFKGNKYTSSLLNTSTVTGEENYVFTPASIVTEVTDVVTSVETAPTKKKIWLTTIFYTWKVKQRMSYKRVKRRMKI